MLDLLIRSEDGEITGRKIANRTKYLTVVHRSAFDQSINQSYMYA